MSTRQKTINWKSFKENEPVADVFILNLDFSESTKLAFESHPFEHREKINDLKKKIANLFKEDNRFCVGNWTGDGLIILFKDETDYVDDLILRAVKVVHLVQEESIKSSFHKPLKIRIGITIGNIRFNKVIGEITEDAMNEAGHLQKYCPNKAGILVAEKVRRYVKNKGVWKYFSKENVLIKEKNEQHTCYYFHGITITYTNGEPIKVDKVSGRFFIGIDIGRNSTKYCLIDYDEFKNSKDLDNCIQRTPGSKDTPIEPNNPQPIYNLLSEIINDIRKHAKTIDGIGLGLPGQVDPQRGRLINSPGLFLTKQICFVDDLKNILKIYNVPIKIDNDVRCATRYERWKYPQYKDIVCIFVGNGLGSGIVVDRKIRYGNTFTTGEAGHTTIFDSGLCRYCGYNLINNNCNFFLKNEKCMCGLEGYHWEQLVCSYGMEIIAKKCKPKEYKKLKKYCKGLKNNNRLKNDDKYNSFFGKHFKKDKDGEEIVTTYAISAAYYVGENDYVKEIVENIFLKYLGIGIANYINIINPEKIFLGGGMIEGFLGHHLKTMAILQKYINGYSLITPGGVVSITPDLGKEHIASLGAALIFKDESYIY